MIQTSASPGSSPEKSPGQPLMRLETNFNMRGLAASFSLFVSGELTVENIEQTVRVLDIIKTMVLEDRARELLNPPSNVDRSDEAESDADSLNQTTFSNREK